MAEPSAMGSTRLLLVAGTTHTAGVEGISAAGADREVMAHTPAADAEILVYGRPVRAPITPVSPSGCPTPAVVTRATRELLGFETTVFDAGLARPTAAPTVLLGDRPGADVRDPIAVPDAADIFETARRVARRLPDEELLIGETVPGGTTTALGVMTALGESIGVSSSLATNPIALKGRVVDDALAASDLEPGAATGDPIAAVRHVGDPVLAAVAGLTVGALASGTEVVLAGGTQLLAAAALVRHAGADAPLSVATTSFVADDRTTDVREAAADLDLDLAVTDPRFERADHVATERYLAGEAKEGVGMGGALALFDRSASRWGTLHDRIGDVYDRCRAD